MTFAKSERLELCDLFDQVGPDAATLCEGWTTHDLAAHLWVRETDPLGAPGILAKPLAGLTERRMNETKLRWSYTELVDRLRNGPARFSVFAIPGLDEGANSMEYFIHHEDVRRGGAEPAKPRDLGLATEDWMWRRLKLMARAFFRRSKIGITLERAGEVAPAAASGTDSAQATAVDDADRRPAASADVIKAAPGSQIVTIVGQPSELVLYAAGRTTAAQVRLIGEPEAVARLTDIELHM